MNYFTSSFIITFAGIVIAYFIGGLYTMYIVVLLAILEISLSFDNAVVNAKILNTMDPIWQRRFIIYGIPIAVFGMRFVFPIVIVAVASGLGFYETFDLALKDSKAYQNILISVEDLIYSFGGAFLLMVFLGFLFDEDREHQWIRILEDNSLVKNFSKVNSIELIIATSLGLYLTYLTSNSSIAIAYFSGILLYSIIISLDDLLSTNGVRSGVIGFLYLEVLDASFSFDGVIGAFALSNDIFIIMIGLGIGAMFVRSLTLYFVEKKTLSEYKYLEHGAHYAILALSLIMFLKMFIHVNEIIVGTIGIGFIAIATIHSVIENKKSEN